MTIRSTLLAGAATGVIAFSSAFAAAPLFESVGAPTTANLPGHVSAAQKIHVNRRSLNAPSFEIDLFGETVTAVRDRVERQKGGTLNWYGNVGGNEADGVIVTMRGNAYSARIDYQGRAYQITGDRRGGFVLNEIDFSGFPQEEPDVLPDGGGEFAVPGFDAATEADPIQQDLLIAYSDDACETVGGTSGVDCSQIEADITAAVADMNASYAASGVDITMNLVGLMEVDYLEDGKGISQMLSELRLTGDGIIDEVHPARDTLGADLVGLVTASGGGFCGVGYRPASPTTAFNVTAEFCLTNRTLAHELGHNQGSLHDRAQHGGGANGAYNYGYRRCNDGSIDDFGSPYFRTTMAYSCSGASRVGRFSNPNVNYLGVATGVDPAVDPTRGAWAARTLNESAAYVASFRDAPVQNPPAAPSGLSASALGSDRIDISWTDNSSDEGSFVVQSSLDESSWSTVATLSANTTSYGDNGLNPETTYFYRVRADNGAGSSGYTNTASATTQSVPSTIDDVADGEIAGAGSVSGNFTATHGDDGVVQTITELGAGGPKKRRKQSFTHTWTVDVFGGAGGVVLTANAWVSGGEGANFYYSTDNGASYNLMFTVDQTSSSTSQTFVLPGGTSGAVRIQARDAAQTNGEPADTLSVDHIVITSNTEVGSPPPAPSAMSVTGVTSSSVSLAFTDNASDEFGFEIWRSTSNPGGDCNAGSSIDTLGANAGTGGVSYTDMSAAPAATYWYWAKAFNGGGENGCSNAASATTDSAPAISASGNGYKVKGVQHADLTWAGAGGASVDIRRNGSVVATTANDGAYTDNIGNKGGGSYSYEVCEAGSTMACSPSFNIVF
ncbi:MAG: hypothetical protein HKN14_11825 [Marinicaulis sp.]|nr:hypothetical protein [Marinicaulis sp.]